MVLGAGFTAVTYSPAPHCVAQSPGWHPLPASLLLTQAHGHIPTLSSFSLTLCSHLWAEVGVLGRRGWLCKPPQMSSSSPTPLDQHSLVSLSLPLGCACSVRTGTQAISVFAVSPPLKRPLNKYSISDNLIKKTPSYCNIPGEEPELGLERW